MKKIVKIALYIAVAALLIIFVYYMIPFVKMLYSEEGRAEINQIVGSFGKLAPLIFISIEIIQIVAAFIPGAPVEVMSGVLFGSFWGVVWCSVGALAGTIIVFFLVRRFGRPLVYKIFPKEKLDSVKILNDEKKLALTVFLLFVIPGTPKDFLTYIAGLTKIEPLKFFFIAAAARLPAMTCSVFMGANIGKGRFLASAVMFAVIVVLSVVGFFVKNKLLNNKKLPIFGRRKKIPTSNLHDGKDTETQ